MAEFYPFNIDPVFNPMDMDKRSLTKAKNAYEFMNLEVGLTPWVNYRGFDSLAIEKIPSTPVYLLHGTYSLQKVDFYLAYKEYGLP